MRPVCASNPVGEPGDAGGVRARDRIVVCPLEGCSRRRGTAAVAWRRRRGALHAPNVFVVHPRSTGPHRWA